MLLRLFTLAARNVTRKPARSLVTIGAMAMAAGVMIFFGAIMIGYIERMKTSALAMETAEAQVHLPGYRDEPDLHSVMPDSAEIAQKLRKDGLFVTERLYGFALAAHEKQSAGVQLRGVDLEHEPKVTRLHTAVGKGQWLSKDKPRAVVIGSKVARRLGLKVGDEFVVLSQAADGSMADDLLTVGGILKPVSAVLDASGVVMGQSAFRELMALHEGSHELVVMRKTGFGDDLLGLETTIRGAAGKHEVATWPKLQPALAEVLRTSDAQLGFMLFIAYLSVVTVVFNATLMSVFERMREFGVLKALGVPPRQIFTVVLTEAGVMAVVAAIAAAGLGLGSCWWFADGIDLSAQVGEMSFNGMTVPPILEPKLNAVIVAGPLVTLVIMVVLAALYPGLKAALVKPIDAIYGR